MAQGKANAIQNDNVAHADFLCKSTSRRATMMSA